MEVPDPENDGIGTIFTNKPILTPTTSQGKRNKQILLTMKPLPLLKKKKRLTTTLTKILNSYILSSTIYGRDMQIYHFFEITACKSKQHLFQILYLYLTPRLTPTLNFSDLLIKN